MMIVCVTNKMCELDFQESSPQLVFRYFTFNNSRNNTPGFDMDRKLRYVQKYLEMENLNLPI